MGKQLARHWTRGQGSRIAAEGPLNYEFATHKRPVSGRKTTVVVNACSAVLVWEMPYWTASAAPHHFGQNFVFADTHAAFEKRKPTEEDWWAYHSRRGWDDNNTGL
jgi:hypothetical protein